MEKERKAKEEGKNAAAARLVAYYWREREQWPLTTLRRR